MADVIIGDGKLGGKGIYAARDFEKDELVVAYDLTELSEEDFKHLPEEEKEWTHSFYGKIYLFPEPERYVNHSDDPTTYPELGRGDVALRAIKKGEAITIDSRIELGYELKTFLEAYEAAANSREFAGVAPFIADDATFWFTNGLFSGKSEIKAAFEDTWRSIQDERYTLSDIRWVSQSYWNAVCTYQFNSDGIVDGVRHVYRGRGTNVLARRDGRWQIVHEHLSR